MRRIQLHLDEELDEALTRQAIAQGVPKAVLIRELLRKALPTLPRRAADPSSQLVAIYEGGEEESTAVDEVVYGR